jgi:hypothetical protein
MYISKVKYKKRKLAFFGIFLWIIIPSSSLVFANPFGTGKFGAVIPYGSLTSLSIGTSGNVSIQITPTESGVLGTANNTVTVTSTDVVGYKLYVRSLSSTDMTNGPAVLPASSNTLPGALSNNTWGYNTDASSNFVGLTLTDVLIKNANGPYSAGDNTQITYGVKVDVSKPAGNYITSVVYTAVPQTE